MAKSRLDKLLKRTRDQIASIEVADGVGHPNLRFKQPLLTAAMKGAAMKQSSPLRQALTSLTQSFAEKGDYYEITDGLRQDDVYPG